MKSYEYFDQTSGLSFCLDPLVSHQIDAKESCCLPVSGYCFHPGHRIPKLELGINGIFNPVQHRFEPRSEFVQKTDDAARCKRVSGFHSVIPIHVQEFEDSPSMKARVTYPSGEQSLIGLGEIPFQKASTPIEIEQQSNIDEPLIAIAMATYEPELLSFKRQIDSIVAQDHANWVLIIRDDGSSQDAQNKIKEICDLDSRIYTVFGTHNKGFYQNFEQCLRLIPGHVDYIALADQDDYWYADKLSSLLRGLDGKNQLVYSDMRIVTNDGSVISTTYWQNRNNEYQDLSVVLVANTVTGAASLFRHELLSNLLPFPVKVGDAFHDHWIACNALARGGISYIDEPLYDYIQHSQSVIGHCDHQQSPWKKKIRSLLYSIWKKRSAAAIKQALAHLRNASLAVYEYECRRIELICATILVRDTGKQIKRKHLQDYDRGFVSMTKLLWLHILVRLRGQTTDGAEIRLAMGYFFKRLDELRFSIRQRTYFFRKRFLAR